MMLARAARRPQLLVQGAAPSMARRAISLGALAPARFARATTPLLDARRQATTKTTTGIVGLPVDPHARETLIALNEKLLEEIKAVPQSAEYRKSVEATCNYRLKCLHENEDEATLEELIGMGQLEELIESQTEELGVLRMVLCCVEINLLESSHGDDVASIAWAAPEISFPHSTSTRRCGR